MTESGLCIKLAKSYSHNHDDDCAERHKKLVVLNELKQKCSDLSTVASGKKMAKVRDIYKQVIVE